MIPGRYASRVDNSENPVDSSLLVLVGLCRVYWKDRFIKGSNLRHVIVVINTRS